MPRSVALNQFFVYLRGQAEAAARALEGSSTPDQGGGGPFALVFKAQPLTFKGVALSFKGQ